MALYTIRATHLAVNIDAGVARSIEEGQRHGRRAVRERLLNGVGRYVVCDNQGRIVAQGSRVREQIGVFVWKESTE